MNYPVLHISGFKSIRDPVELELKPLTLISGANSSGKSSLLQPLLLIKQTLEAPFDPGPLLLDGENVSFTSSSQMFWRGNEEDSMSVGITDADGFSSRLEFGRIEEELALNRMRFRDPEVSSRFRSLREELPSSRVRRLIPERYFEDLDESTKRRLVFGVERDRCFLRITATLRATRTGTLPLISPVGSLARLAGDLIHVSGLRDAPERYYPATQVGHIFPGRFHPYVASVLQDWEQRSDSRLGLIGDDLRQLGLTWKVSTHRLDETRVAVRVGRLPVPKRGGARDLVNISDVGLGISQVLPALVAMRQAKKEQIVLIEQPEIHLHPRAQIALGGIAANAAAKGAFLLVETHSLLFLRSLQRAVLADELNPDLVGLNWVERDSDGVTRIQHGAMDDRGTFGGWPEDFADEELQLESELIELAMDSD